MDKSHITENNEYLRIKAVALSFLKSIEQKRSGCTPFAYHVAIYITDNPEKAAELAQKHYSDYLRGKVDYMAWETIKNKHRNPLIDRQKGTSTYLQEVIEQWQISVNR